jgi:hypothetical protein
MAATSLHWPTKIQKGLRRQFFAMRPMVAIPPAAFIL